MGGSLQKVRSAGHFWTFLRRWSLQLDWRSLARLKQRFKLPWFGESISCGRRVVTASVGPQTEARYPLCGLIGWLEEQPRARAGQKLHYPPLDVTHTINKYIHKHKQMNIYIYIQLYINDYIYGYINMWLKMIKYDYIWLYMMIHDDTYYIWLNMMMQIVNDYIWLHVIIHMIAYDYIWLNMIIYDYIWLYEYMILYDYIWLYMIIYHYKWLYVIYI